MRKCAAWVSWQLGEYSRSGLRLAIIPPVLLAGRGRGILDRIVLKARVAVPASTTIPIVPPVPIIPSLISLISSLISVPPLISVPSLISAIPPTKPAVASAIPPKPAIAAPKSAAAATEPAEPSILPLGERAGKGRAPLEDRRVGRGHGAEDGEEDVLGKHLDECVCGLLK